MDLGLVMSDQPDPTLYFSFLNGYAEEMKKLKKGIAFLGDTFIIGILGNPGVWNPKNIMEYLTGKNGNEEKKEKRKDLKGK